MTGAAVQRVINALTDHGSTPKPSNGSYKALCPAHDDHNPSLSITQGTDGRVLLKCFTGCQPEDIVAALGLSMPDLFESRPKPRESRLREVRAYDYLRPDGSLSYQVVRYDPKNFKQRRPGGPDGWVWDLKDLSAEDRELPFKLPELAAFRGGQPEQALVIAEGEKDCLAIWEQEIPATCNAGGAGKWKDGHSKAVIRLSFTDVVIIADRDEPGKSHALAVRDSLRRNGYKGHLRTVIAVCDDGCKDPADLIAHHGKDWRDHFDDLIMGGVTSGDTLSLPTGAPDVATKLSPSISYEWGASVECVKPDWLWRDWLCKGALHVLAGKQSGGKSTWVAYVIARLLQGRLDAPSGLKAGVISLEESNDRLAARLRASGADMDRVALYLTVTDQDKDGKQVERPWRLPQDLDALKGFIVSVGLSLLVVDGAGYAISGNQDYANVGTVLSGLAKVAERTGCAILAITHTRKEGTTDAVTAAIGSTAWTAIPRICWVCGVDPDDETESRRIVAVSKTNYKRPKSSIAYTIADDEEFEVGYATNIKEVATTADQVVAPREPVEDRSELAEAKRIVRGLLSDGPMLSTELTKLAKKEGVSERTLQRARNALNVRSEQRREGGSLIGWEVSLPELGHLGHLGQVRVKTGQKPSSALECQHRQTDDALGGLGTVGASRENTLKTESLGQHGQPPSESRTTTEELTEVPEVIHRPEKSTEDEPPCSQCGKPMFYPDSIDRGFCEHCRLHPPESEPIDELF